MVDEPTDEGKRLWPPDGYLRLKPGADTRARVACTCTDGCGDCNGACGCEACALDSLIYQDDQALWDEHGDLVNVVDLGVAWHSVSDPRQLRLRFHTGDKCASVNADLTRDGSFRNPSCDGEFRMPASHQPVHGDSTPSDHATSVPPVFEEHRSPIPEPPGWQKHLPSAPNAGSQERVDQSSAMQNQGTGRKKK